MKKKNIIEALEKFNNEDEIAFEGGSTPSWGELWGEFRRVCGKGQAYMPYTCILKPGHEGECYCGCKKIEFIPD